MAEGALLAPDRDHLAASSSELPDSLSCHLRAAAGVSRLTHGDTQGHWMERRGPVATRREKGALCHNVPGELGRFQTPLPPAEGHRPGGAHQENHPAEPSQAAEPGERKGNQAVSVALIFATRLPDCWPHGGAELKQTLRLRVAV